VDDTWPHRSTGRHDQGKEPVVPIFLGTLVIALAAIIIAQKRRTKDRR
jgi:hypothetical protein